MYSDANNENVYIGLNPVMERFLHERRMKSGKTVPRGCSHAVLTMEEYDEFNFWRKDITAMVHRLTCVPLQLCPMWQTCPLT